MGNDGGSSAARQRRSASEGTVVLMVGVMLRKVVEALGLDLGGVAPRSVGPVLGQRSVVVRMGGAVVAVVSAVGVRARGLERQLHL